MNPPKKLVQQTDATLKLLESTFTGIAPVQGWHAETDRIGLAAVKSLKYAIILFTRARDFALLPGSSPSEVQRGFKNSAVAITEFSSHLIGLATAVMNIKAQEQRYDKASIEIEKRLLAAVDAFTAVMPSVTPLVSAPYDPKSWA